MSDHEDRPQEEQLPSGNDGSDIQPPQTHTVDVHAGERAVAAGGSITNSPRYCCKDCL
jgi:hypothetical protein